MEVAAAGQCMIEQLRQVASIAVEPSLFLDEVQKQHSRQSREREGVAVVAAAGLRQTIGEPLQGVSESPEEPDGDRLAGEGIADPQGQCRGGLRGSRGEPLERREGDRRRSREGERSEPDAEGRCGRSSPGGEHEAARRPSHRARKAAVSAAGEPLCGEPCSGFRVARLEGDHPVRLVPRDQLGGGDSSSAHFDRAEPGPGWYGLPRRVIAEHAKEVAKIGDLLGAGEKLPEHHGPLGSKGPKMRSGAPGLGTGVLQAGSKRRGAYDALRSVMLPFTVRSSSERPPDPIVPRRCRGPNLPVTVSGKSVSRSPFTVSARTSALRFAGSVSVMPPFTVVNRATDCQSLRPIDARIEPFTVVASTCPAAVTSTLPFTVLTSASAPRLSAWRSPFTVRPSKLMPGGSLIVKSTSTSLLSVLEDQSSPGSQLFSRRARRGVGYTAQIATPSSNGTTLISTSSGSERRAVLRAVTSI